ncbi:GerAB/ArcD/ProY family transporter [Priestia koreensis]|uniref:Spore gernimation protein GerB n=1 Tax=Priestia koreensis TaxID=284581 RepID=A0A0M0LHM3_9BACI|nr:GerAB/ArcD/ProY family transporter [Priestia koreensis]KOO50461.1 spore gernimation protein GerB [Priestia koreensis]MCM3003012.1 spore germination protein [Priestia koreensis]
MESAVKPNHQVSPYFAFLLIHGPQVGVGILGYQRILIQGAGQDSWITVITAGVGVSLLIAMCYYILNLERRDLSDIHRLYFGKWLGGMANLVWALYFCMLLVTVYRTYIEVIQVWMFPLMQTWMISIVLIPLIYYIIMGGFRVVAGMIYFSIIFPLPLMLSFIFPMQYAHVENVLPFLEHNLYEYFLSHRTMNYEYLGFEFLLLYYPFIKNAQKSHKWAQAGNLFTILIYLVITLVSLMYFSQGQLNHAIWATLTMAKIIEIPFIQRFEYVIIALWLLVVMPGICLSAWGFIRMFKKQFGGKSSWYLRLVVVLLFVGAIYFKDRQMINLLNNTVSQFGFYLVYGYIPFLFIIAFIRKRIKTKKAQRNASL